MAFIHGETRDERKARLLAEGIEDTGPSGTMGDLMRSLGFLPKFTNDISDSTTTGFSTPPPMSNPAEAMYREGAIEQEPLAAPDMPTAPPPSAPSLDAGGYYALANVQQEPPAAPTVGTSSPAGPVPAFPPIPRGNEGLNTSVPLDDQAKYYADRALWDERATDRPYRAPHMNEGLNEAVPQADVDAAEYNRTLAANARGPEHPAREIPALIKGSPTAVADAADKFRELAMSAPGAVSTAFAKLTDAVVAEGGDMDQVFTRIWSSPTIQQLAPNFKKLLSNVWNDYKAAHPLRDTSKSVYTQKQQPGLPPNVGGL